MHLNDGRQMKKFMFLLSLIETQVTLLIILLGIQYSGEFDFMLKRTARSHRILKKERKMSNPFCLEITRPTEIEICGKILLFPVKLFTFKNVFRCAMCLNYFYYVNNTYSLISPYY